MYAYPDSPHTTLLDPNLLSARRIKMDAKPRANSDRASDVEKASDVQEATRPALDDAARRVAEKKLVRKIDTRMSILVLIYILNVSYREVFRRSVAC